MSDRDDGTIGVWTALALMALLLVLIAWDPTHYLPRAPATTRPPAPTAAAVIPSPATGCLARGPLPDPRCTPGATNDRVTQATISSTICVVGWTGTIRPDVGYTNALKAEQMRAYGLTGPASSYEEDHLLPLELGGAPRDPRNLWPQPIEGAQEKDRLENALRRLVCAGAMPLEEAQRCILEDWTACDRRIGP